MLHSVIFGATMQRNFGQRFSDNCEHESRCGKTALQVAEKGLLKVRSCKFYELAVYV